MNQKTSYQTLWFVLICLIVGTIGIWIFFYVSDQRDKVDLDKIASVAKQGMLELKSEAQKVSAATWAEETYSLASQKEQIGEEQFASNNYGAAKQAYVIAGRYFRQSTAEANLRSAPNLDRLRDSVVKVRQAMLNEKLAAENVGAKIQAKVVYENALRKELSGQETFRKGDRNSLLLAQNAYADARDGYKKAKTQLVLDARFRHDAEKARNQLVVDAQFRYDAEEARNQIVVDAQFRYDAEKAKTEMAIVKRQTPEGEQERRASPNFNRALLLDTAGQRHFEEGNWTAAHGSFLRAKHLYVAAMNDINNLLRSRADTVRESILAAKAKIDKDETTEDKYKEGMRIEKEADKAYRETRFDKAHEKYETAHDLYTALSREAEEKVVSERQQQEMTKQAIQRLISKYKKILENGDIDALKALLSLTEQEESSWETFFNNTLHKKAIIENRGLQFSSSNDARADLFVRLSYYNKSNNRRENRPFPITLILETVNDKWEIISQK